MSVGGEAKVDDRVQAVFNAHMHDTLTPPARAGLTQALGYECINLAAVGSTNVWMHFRKRVLAYARTAHALEEDAYKALSKDERRARKLAIMQAADDVCRIPTEGRRSPQLYHACGSTRRARVWASTPRLGMIGTTRRCSTTSRPGRTASSRPCT